jgi:hypothetical protein
MSENNNNIRDEYLDAAAGEAIGAAPAEETAALGEASAEEKQAARELRETVARMAAASPYMSPSAELRGKILAATAPATFRMEDYKKATRDDAKWWRYGVIAATLFLVAAAYYNISARNQLKARDAEVASLRQAVEDQNTALSMIADPKTEKAALKANNKVAGAVLLDNTSKTAVVIASADAFPAGKAPSFQVTRNGVTTVYRTIPVIISGQEAGGTDFAGGRKMEINPFAPTDRAVPAGMGGL